MSSLVDHLERQDVGEAGVVEALAVEAKEERLLLRGRHLIDAPPVAVSKDALARFLFSVGETDEELVLERDQHLRRLLLRDPSHDLEVRVGTPAVEVREHGTGPPADVSDGVFVQVTTAALVDACRRGQPPYSTAESGWREGPQDAPLDGDHPR